MHVWWGKYPQVSIVFFAERTHSKHFQFPVSHTQIKQIDIRNSLFFLRKPTWKICRYFVLKPTKKSLKTAKAYLLSLFLLLWFMLYLLWCNVTWDVCMSIVPFEIKSKWNGLTLYIYGGNFCYRTIMRWIFLVRLEFSIYSDTQAKKNIHLITETHLLSSRLRTFLGECRMPNTNCVTKKYWQI